MISFTRFSRCANSASVSSGLSANCFGRSSGVIVLFAHTPSRSGWPSAVRGRVQRFGAGFDVEGAPCGSPAATGTASRQARSSPIFMIASHQLNVHAVRILDVEARLGAAGRGDALPGEPFGEAFLVEAFDSQRIVIDSDG